MRSKLSQGKEQKRVIEQRCAAKLLQMEQNHLTPPWIRNSPRDALEGLRELSLISPVVSCRPQRRYTEENPAVSTTLLRGQSIRPFPAPSFIQADP